MGMSLDLNSNYTFVNLSKLLTLYAFISSFTKWGK